MLTEAAINGPRTACSASRRTSSSASSSRPGRARRRTSPPAARARAPGGPRGARRRRAAGGLRERVQPVPRGRRRQRRRRHGAAHGAARGDRRRGRRRDRRRIRRDRGADDDDLQPVPRGCRERLGPATTSASLLEDLAGDTGDTAASHRLTTPRSGRALTLAGTRWYSPLRAMTGRSCARRGPGPGTTGRDPPGGERPTTIDEKGAASPCRRSASSCAMAGSRRSRRSRPRRCARSGTASTSARRRFRAPPRSAASACRSAR